MTSDMRLREVLDQKKSQNCVKAEIAFMCTPCKRQLLFALLQLITFVSTTVINNFLCTATIINFCMHYYTITLLQ